MDAVCFLKQLDKLNAIIENKRVEKARWRDMALSITGHSDGERVQSSGNKQKMADAVIEYSDIDAEIGREIIAAELAKREIIKTIERLEAKEYDVLHKIYFQHLTAKEIAAARNRSVSWVRDTHSQALKSLQLILDERNAGLLESAAK